MKKLLGLLSVLTISGTAVPTTIAASPYQKEENIKNIDINKQINNLENLKRIKRWNQSLSNLISVTSFWYPNNISKFGIQSYFVDDFVILQSLARANNTSASEINRVAILWVDGYAKRGTLTAREGSGYTGTVSFNFYTY